MWRLKQRATEQRRNQGPISKYNQIQSHLGLGLQMDFQFCSVHFSRSVVSSSLQPHESQHARPSCPSPTPRVYPNSCPLSPWCHLTISSSVVPFSSCLQSFPASFPSVGIRNQLLGFWRKLLFVFYLKDSAKNHAAHSATHCVLNRSK